jgi:hypothetical protein
VITTTLPREPVKGMTTKINIGKVQTQSPTDNQDPKSLRMSASSFSDHLNLPIGKGRKSVSYEDQAPPKPVVRETTKVIGGVQVARLNQDSSLKVMGGSKQLKETTDRVLSD